MATELSLLRSGTLLDHAFRVSGEPTKKCRVTRALPDNRAPEQKRRWRSSSAELEWTRLRLQGPNVIASCDLLVDTSVWSAGFSPK